MSRGSGFFGRNTTPRKRWQWSNLTKDKTLHIHQASKDNPHLIKDKLQIIKWKTSMPRNLHTLMFPIPSGFHGTPPTKTPLSHVWLKPRSNASIENVLISTYLTTPSQVALVYILRSSHMWCLTLTSCYWYWFKTFSLLSIQMSCIIIPHWRCHISIFVKFIGIPSRKRACSQWKFPWLHVLPCTIHAW